MNVVSLSSQFSSNLVGSYFKTSSKVIGTWHNLSTWDSVKFLLKFVASFGSVFIEELKPYGYFPCLLKLMMSHLLLQLSHVHITSGSNVHVQT